MKAVVCTQYGSPDVFSMDEMERPSPKKNEVLVKIFATTVTGSDIMMRKGKPYIGRLYLGLKRPKTPILGFDFAGEVMETGIDVSSFKVGDKVFGGTTTLGCYAEFVCVNVQDVITTIPENISYQEAAPVSASAITVMHFLKGLANIQKADKVLINGASGSLGTYAVQVAKHFGAEVTAVCSTINLDMVKSLGADKVIDYTEEDFVRRRDKYDIIFDTVGKKSFSQCKNSLTKKGIYLSSVLTFPLLIQFVITSIFGSKKARFSSTGMLSARERLNYCLQLKELLKAQKIKTVIDQQYALAQLADAHKYVENGHKRGNVIINI